MMKKYFKDGDNDKYLLKLIGGIAGYALEITCWVMFYVAYSDGLKYAEYLIAAGKAEGQHASFIWLKPSSLIVA